MLNKIYKIVLFFCFFLLAFITIVYANNNISIRGECISELKKEKLDKNIVKQKCLILAQELESQREYAGASWYYLLSGELDPVMNMTSLIQQDGINPSLISNISHASLIKGQTRSAYNTYAYFLIKATRKYVKELSNEDFLRIDNIVLKNPLPILITTTHLENDFKMLHKIYDSNDLNRINQVWPELHEYFTLNLQERIAARTEGNLLYQQGKYPEALAKFQFVLKDSQTLYGVQFPEVARANFLIAKTYHALGDDLNALTFARQALKINLATRVREHIEVADTQHLLGRLYLNLKEYSTAIAFFEKAIRAKKETLGLEHPSLARSLSGLGKTYSSDNNYTKALDSFKLALNIQEKYIGVRHPETAATYDNLGMVFYSQKSLKNALENIERAASIRNELLSPFHPDSIKSNSHLSLVYLKKSDYSSSYKYAGLAFDSILKNRNNYFSSLNRKQKKEYLKSNNSAISQFFLVANKYQLHLRETGDVELADKIVKELTNRWFNYKGSIFESENLFASIAKASPDKAIRDMFVKLNDLKRSYSVLLQTYPVEDANVKTWKENVKEHKEEIDLLTAKITHSSPKFKKLLVSNNKLSRDIAGFLKQEELYADFGKTNDGYYLFTIDNKNKVSFTAYNKEDSKAIDVKIKAFQEDIQTFVSKGKIPLELMTKLNKSSKQSLAKLYKRIFNKTLLAKIADKKTLVISPDGALRLLPFEALYDAEKQGGGQYLIESKDIRYIASGKELVRLARQNKGKTNANKAVLFANPNFGGKPSKETHETRSTVYTPNTDASKTMGTLSLSPKFKALAGTKKEADAIAKVLTLKEILHDYRGNDANEANLLAVKHPNILHIATHGFFLKDIPNPMLKSGLILAGANKSLKANKGDGIVTALDLSGLELQGTDLVVLSACETGKVDPNNTDGISGLTKAFIQAGAKNVVMSLWSVADKETAELMTAFYKAGKEDKQYAKALKKSKLALLDKGMHPYYWAAFVLSGGN